MNGKELVAYLATHGIGKQSAIEIGRAAMQYETVSLMMVDGRITWYSGESIAAKYPIVGYVEYLGNDDKTGARTWEADCTAVAK